MLALVIGEDWYPIIGDPTFIGWFTVFAYFVAAFLCWKATVYARRTRPPAVIRAAAIFWFLLTCFMVFLGINKQLDLQTWMTNIGRKVARAQTWYDHRQIVQVVFIGSVLVAGLCIVAVLGWLSRGAFRRQWLALAGAIFLGCFIMIRAASFHHIDQLLGLRFGGVTVNAVLELGGIFAIALCAGRNSIEFRREWLELHPSKRPWQNATVP